MTDFNSIMTSDKPFVVLFSANWCGACKMVYPIFEHFESLYKDKINFIKLDADENSSLFDELKIRSIPSLKFYKNKTLVTEMSGATSKTKFEDLLTKIL